jgi:hypothetical protein
MSVRYKINLDIDRAAVEGNRVADPHSFTATADKNPDPAFSKLDPVPDPGSKAQDDVYIKKT